MQRVGGGIGYCYQQAVIQGSGSAGQGTCGEVPGKARQIARINFSFRAVRRRRGKECSGFPLCGRMTAGRKTGNFIKRSEARCQTSKAVNQEFARRRFSMASPAGFRCSCPGPSARSSLCLLGRGWSGGRCICNGNSRKKRSGPLVRGSCLRQCNVVWIRL